MAVYKLFPTKDTTIYTEDPDMNTGLDEILEFSTYNKDGNFYISRALVEFSQTEIENTINNKISGSNWDAYLKLFNAEIFGLNLESYIETYPISGSWNMGTGKYLYDPSLKNGCSWNSRLNELEGFWSTSSFGNYVTASYYSVVGGGTWYTGSALDLPLQSTQSFSYSDNKDIKLPVKNTVLNWYSGSLVNNGFIIKQPNEAEINPNNYTVTSLKYFSIDTNTIYPPCLEFKWDDSVYNTGSANLNVVDNTEILIAIANTKNHYYKDDIEQFRLNIKLKYPPRVYQTSSIYTNNNILPEDESYYAIKDAITNEYIIDFDEQYTKLSADEKGNYFTVYMDGLEPERFYTIIIKTSINNSTQIYDFNNTFKIING
jgi:hypothetical protein